MSFTDQFNIPMPTPSAQHQLTWQELYNLIEAMPADMKDKSHNIQPLYEFTKLYSWFAVYNFLTRNKNIFNDASPIYVSDLAEPEKQLYYRIKYGIDISPKTQPTNHKPYQYIGACWLFLTGIFIWLSGTFNAAHWSTNAKYGYIGLTCLLMLFIFFAATIFAPPRKL